MPVPVLGIDLGTTNSVVAVFDGTSVRVIEDPINGKLTPSVVSFHPSGDVLIGKPARERRVIDAANTIFSIKRLIGLPYKSPILRQAQQRFPFKLVEGPADSILARARGKSYTLPEISALVLGRLRKTAENELGETCTDAVLAVPANFNELQRTATRDAARIAGLNVLRIINEPTAAALAYGYGSGKRERIAVYDFGGGTFDISVLDLAGDVFEVVATAGDPYLGGDDVDNLIAKKIVRFFLQRFRIDLSVHPDTYERLQVAAEWLKCELTEQEKALVYAEDIAHGDQGVPLDLEFELDRQQLEQIAFPLIGRSFDKCEEALRIAGVRPPQLQRVILVGGSTRAPQVRRMVSEYFEQEPMTSVDPDLVVAYGAALQGHALVMARAKKRVISERPAATPVSNVSGAEPFGYKQPPRYRPGDLDWVLQEEAPEEPVTEVAPRPVGTPLASVTRPPAPARAAPPSPPIAPEASAPAPAERRTAPEPPPAQAPSLRPPLLLDVTPRTLGVVAAGGYCEDVIERNSPVPTEQTRIFATSQDGQTEVQIRIYQGEGRRIEQNQELGVIYLLGLTPARRGRVQIEVTFIIDADGILGVGARDMVTGQQKRARISLRGQLSDAEVAKLRERHAKLTSGG